MRSGERKGGKRQASRAKFICIGPTSLFRAEIQLIGFSPASPRAHVCKREKLFSRPFFFFFCAFRGAKGSRKREEVRRLIQFRPYAAAPVLLPRRLSLFLSFSFTSLCAVSFNVKEKRGRKGLLAATIAVDPAGIYFSVRKHRALNSPGVTGFKYGRPRIRGARV